MLRNKKIVLALATMALLKSTTAFAGTASVNLSPELTGYEAITLANTQNPVYGAIFAGTSTGTATLTLDTNDTVTLVNAGGLSVPINGFGGISHKSGEVTISGADGTVYSYEVDVNAVAPATGFSFSDPVCKLNGGSEVACGTGNAITGNTLAVGADGILKVGATLTIANNTAIAGADTPLTNARWSVTVNYGA